MSISDIRKQLNSVTQDLKACQKERDRLRNDMERGKIRLRVNNSPEFRREVAARVTQQAEPGYHDQGKYYADPVAGKVWFLENDAAWNPWSEDIDWRVLPVDYLVDDGDGSNDFSPAVGDMDDWRVALESKPHTLGQILRAWLDSENEELEPNGDIPEWAWDSYSEAISWVEGQEEYAATIQEVRNDASEAAIAFALSEILEEVEIDLLEARTA